MRRQLGLTIRVYIDHSCIGGHKVRRQLGILVVELAANQERQVEKRRIPLAPLLDLGGTDGEAAVVVAERHVSTEKGRHVGALGG